MDERYFEHANSQRLNDQSRTKPPVEVTLPLGSANTIFTHQFLFDMDLNINDRIYKVDVDSGESLLTVLRDDLDLTGSKYGCGEGACGACTVLVNGSPTRSCITKVGTLSGKKIVTIEGLEKAGKLHPVQEACLDVDVFQCSYCASGMIMSAVALLNKTRKPTETEIRSAMQGNVCRCGTHTRIVDAVNQASKA